MRLVGWPDGELSSIIGCYQLKHVSLVADIEKVRKGHIVGGLRRTAFPDLYQPERIFVRQRSKHDGVDDAEDCRVGADPKREGADGNRGQAAVPAEHAECVEQILAKLVDEGAGPDVSDRLSHLLNTSELDERGAPGLAVRHACGTSFVRRHLDVRVQLVVQIALDAVAKGEVPPNACDARA